MKLLYTLKATWTGPFVISSRWMLAMPLMAVGAGGLHLGAAPRLAICTSLRAAGGDAFASSVWEASVRHDARALQIAPCHWEVAALATMVDASQLTMSSGD
eukprot:CAMPEP_0115517806 /NCGR_PEP_ID=MMETSP0271-20121206/77519_1 /TAXON_ID=71861 /ORGANISM="Scrippsiella trochoidea, Strain CCMP3099" /LENGTH=100 /DNA_ID=CAMNT_0002948615 /DNA_START=14 /DNA_END=313 /DNA_ORIENTATION=-